MKKLLALFFISPLAFADMYIISEDKTKFEHHHTVHQLVCVFQDRSSKNGYVFYNTTTYPKFTSTNNRTVSTTSVQVFHNTDGTPRSCVGEKED